MLNDNLNDVFRYSAWQIQVMHYFPFSEKRLAQIKVKKIAESISFDKIIDYNKKHDRIQLSYTMKKYITSKILEKQIKKVKRHIHSEIANMVDYI